MEQEALDGTVIQWSACGGCGVSIPVAPPTMTERGPRCFICQGSEQVAMSMIDWMKTRRAEIAKESERLRLQIRDYEEALAAREPEPTTESEAT